MTNNSKVIRMVGTSKSQESHNLTIVSVDWIRQLQPYVVPCIFCMWGLHKLEVMFGSGPGHRRGN